MSIAASAVIPAAKIVIGSLSSPVFGADGDVGTAGIVTVVFGTVVTVVIVVAGVVEVEVTGVV